MTPDLTAAHSGARALHMRVDPVTNQVAGSLLELWAGLSLNPAEPTLYLRVFVYGPSNQWPTDNPMGILSAGTGSDQFFLFFPSPQSLYVNSLRKSLSAPGTLPSPTQWRCLEWELSPGLAQVYVDDNLASSWSGLPSETWDFVQFGVSLYEPGPTAGYELWYDDVVIDRTRIHCDF